MGQIAFQVAGFHPPVGQFREPIPKISERQVKLNVKVLAIDGVQPSQQSVLDKSYRLSRPLQLLIGPLSRSIARTFITFALSDEGQRIIAADGWVPVRELK